MDRSASREEAFKLLYSMEMQKEASQEVIDMFIESNEIDNAKTIEYIQDVANGVQKQEEEIIKTIMQNLKADWQIERISKINLAILKLAIYEIIYNNVPYKVGINEAVEIAKKYSEETSASFINGVLASVVKQSGKSE